MGTVESKIQTEICKWLTKQNALFWRSNNTPIWDKKLNNGYGAYRGMGAYARKGVPDIIVIDRHGTFVGVECKTSRGKLSPDQLLFKKQLERRFGRYIVATCVSDVSSLPITW